MKKRKLKGVIIMASKLDKLREKHADKALDANELDNVAGGNMSECWDDAYFLSNLMKGHPARPEPVEYGKWYTVDDMRNRLDSIRVARAMFGIEARVSVRGDIAGGNLYFYNGASISQQQAMDIAKDKMSRGQVCGWITPA